MVMLQPGTGTVPKRTGFTSGTLWKILFLWKAFLKLILVSQLKRGRILGASDEYIFYLFIVLSKF